MAKYQTKAKTQKVYKKNKAVENIIPKNCVAVFPLLIVSGATYITEHGTMPQNLVYDKGSFLFWQEVFDGRKAIKIQWDGAITLEKPIGENYYLADTKVGKYFFGKPISNSTESLDIGEDASFDEFITMKSNQSITLRFEFDKSNRLYYDNLKEDLRFVDNDLYKLYLIPEICEGKLMYISDYEEGYEDSSGLSYWCEITFQTLGNELQKSGKAVEQYPRWSAPGEFYVKPKIEYSTGEERVKRIIIDPAGLNPKPIKYLQVELQGPALTSCVYALGRRQEKDPTTGKWKIGPSKHLLGSRFITTQPNPLNRTSTPTKNYNCYIDEEVCFATNAEFLGLLTDKVSQPLEQMKNGGLISLGNSTDYVNGIFGEKEGSTGIHKSNNPLNASGERVRETRYDYFDSNWHPLEQLVGEDGKTYNASGCVYCEDTMTYNQDDTMIDIMNKNAFTFNQQPIIPLSMYSSRPFYLRQIPLIGAIANFFSLGDIRLFNNTINRQTSNLIFFADSELCAMCSQLQQGLIGENWFPFKQAGKVAFPINFFGNNETSYNKLGVNSVNTTFCIELTDKITMEPTDYEGPYTSFDTLWLGQATDEEGTPFYEDDPGRTLLANGTMKAQITPDAGYIIDAVIVQTIFDGKIRISAYSTEDDTLLVPEWTTTILSNANWQGGAMRDWTNMFLLSNWEDRFCRQQDEFTYPLSPKKQNENEVILDTTLKESFELVNSPGAYKNFPEEWSVGQGIYKEVEASGYTRRNQQGSNTYSIQYISLGIPSVVDRQSFKDYFENIQPNFQQSQIYYRAHDQQEQTITLNDQFRTIGGISQSADINEYDFEVPILSINNNIEGWRNINLKPWADEVWELGHYYNVSPLPLVWKGKLGTTLKPTIHIELTKTEIQISIIDNSIMIGWNVHGSGTSLDGTLCLYRTAGSLSARTNTVGYTINMPQLKFVKRGANTSFSNKIYGKKQ